MKCRCCGAQMDASETRCSYCGTIVKQEAAQKTQDEQQYTSSYYDTQNNNVSNEYSTNQTQPYSYQPYRYEEPPVSYDYDQYRQSSSVAPQNYNAGIVPLITGFLSIFFGFSMFGFIFAIIAMITGSKAKQSSNSIEQKRGKTGFTMGLIMIVVEVLIIGIFFFAFIATEIGGY